VLVLRGVPKEAIRRLRVGDFFMGEEIVNTQRKRNLICIVTKNGSVFNAHEKMKAFNVFKKVKRPAGNDTDGDKNHKHEGKEDGRGGPRTARILTDRR
jgi:hypothetical protein